MRRLLGLAVVLALASACGSTVSVSAEDDAGAPIDLAPEQTLEVQLETNRAISNDPEAFAWVVLESGVVELESVEHRTRSEPESEFVGGYSIATIFTFRPTMIGTGELVIGYVPVGEGSATPEDTFTITVISKRD